jgi:hypothetical protein
VRTKLTITPEEQKIGKLVQHLPEDAMCINYESLQIFDIIRDICRKVHLASMVPILPASSLVKKKNAIAINKKRISSLIVTQS